MSTPRILSLKHPLVLHPNACQPLARALELPFQNNRDPRPGLPLSHRPVAPLMRPPLGIISHIQFRE